MRLLLLAALSPAFAALEKTTECPEGAHRVSTNDPYEPFKCEKGDGMPDPGFGSVVGPRGFAARPNCPRGTRPVFAGAGALQRYRCMPSDAVDPDPELAPMRPANAGWQKLAPGKGSGGAGEYRRWSVPGELSFDYPRTFKPQDNWKDETPTVTFTLDEERGGKPVTLTLSRADPEQPAYLDVDAAVAKDKEWQGAKEDGRGRVGTAGLPARYTLVAGESRTAYVDLGRGAYYTVVYSAPAESFERHLPAFKRLLRTLSLPRRTP